MHEDAKMFGFVISGVGGESPVRVAIGCVANADVGALAFAPVIQGEHGLFGVVVMHLHGTIAVGRLDRRVTKVKS